MFSFNQLVMRDVLGEIRYTPWPIDVEAFPFRERHRCERFVFAHGNGGPRDRKGGKIVAEAARLRPNIPLIVYSQAQEGYRSTLTEDVDWPASVDFRGAVPKPQDLYREGDVMILPSRWEGLGLQLFESLASGMPLVTTDAPPMNEAHAWARLPCEPKRIRLSHDYLSFDVSPRTLADAMWRLSGQEISNESHISRDWVESNRSWHVLGERVQRAIQEPL